MSEKQRIEMANNIEDILCNPKRPSIEVTEKEAQEAQEAQEDLTGCPFLKNKEEHQKVIEKSREIIEELKKQD